MKKNHNLMQKGKFYLLRCLIMGVVLTPFGLINPSFALQNDSPALEKYRTGAFDDALRLWAPMAIGGNPEAQYYIGDMYQNGLGLKADISNAILFYTAAADRGHLKAERTLAEVYFMGNGVTQDMEKALQYYWSAGIKGDALSQYHLGRFYMKGDGVDTNLVQAFAWLDRAVANGNKLAGPLMLELNRSLDQNQIAQAKLLSENLEVGEQKWIPSPLEDAKALALLKPFTMAKAPSRVAVADTNRSSLPARVSNTGSFMGEWQVHLGSFRDENRAIEAGKHLERMAPQILRGKKWATQLANRDANKAKFYRLRLGGYETFEGANTACNDLILKGFSCMVASR